MTIELSLFNTSVTTLVGHLTTYYGEEAELETYVICARGKSPQDTGWQRDRRIVGPNGHGRAGGLMREVIKAVDSDDSHNGQP